MVETWAGGIASYVTALMIEQRASGHDVALVCDPRNMDVAKLGVDDIDVVAYRASRNPFRFVAISRTLRAIVKMQHANVIHCHSSYPGVYVRFSRFEEEKVLYTPHAWSFMKKDISRVTAIVFALVERWLARRCTRILCMSFDEVRAANRYGIAPDKLELVYTGIPTDTAAEPLEVETDGGAQPAPHIQVGYFGRLDYQKGFDILVDALPLLEEHLHVHVFGTAVRGGVEMPDPASRVVYHGWVGPEETQRAMRRMDVIVVPSRWEGLALVPIEAMRAGKVLVVSSESSLPEQVIHGYNGLMLRQLTGTCLAEQLNSLSIDECRRMGANSRHVFDEAFNAEKFFKSLMNYYESA
ncbi:glycosyltransferase family 4 protein [Paraburkholderia caribensis]|uniref:glycosyltransferase family 4 protein n=1 Tax=Paraburkholderia caribensis TaxID=75105 RepID=UPI001CAFA109|nr:glycosyltransferase family 4 protein [Paraburkholderia caribensis]CAG9272365.1 Glycosyltransferase family 1 protein [Paraburkholderia caribensis]